jgi:hypothetical protein
LRIIDRQIHGTSMIANDQRVEDVPGHLRLQPSLTHSLACYGRASTCLPDESPEDWEARWTAVDDDFRARAKSYERAPLAEWPGALRADLESSWEAIFDPGTWSAKRTLQATMREICSADVVRAVRIQ